MFGGRPAWFSTHPGFVTFRARQRGWHNKPYLLTSWLHTEQLMPVEKFICEMDTKRLMLSTPHLLWARPLVCLSHRVLPRKSIIYLSIFPVHGSLPWNVEEVRDLDLALPRPLCDGAHPRPRALHTLCLAEHAGSWPEPSTPTRATNVVLTSPVRLV